MKACGVPEKEIQTDHLSIEPRWKNDFYKDEFIAYALRNTLVVTITESEKVEDLITRRCKLESTPYTGSVSKPPNSKRYEIKRENWLLPLPERKR